MLTTATTVLEFKEFSLATPSQITIWAGLENQPQQNSALYSATMQKRMDTSE